MDGYIFNGNYFKEKIENKKSKAALFISVVKNKAQGHNINFNTKNTGFLRIKK
jgi:hypothetical protein